MKPLARKLLDTFGDFNRVLSASASRLQQVPGLGAATVTDVWSVDGRVLHSLAGPLPEVGTAVTGQVDDESQSFADAYERYRGVPVSEEDIVSYMEGYRNSEAEQQDLLESLLGRSSGSLRMGQSATQHAFLGASSGEADIGSLLRGVMGYLRRRGRSAAARRPRPRGRSSPRSCASSGQRSHRTQGCSFRG